MALPHGSLSKIYINNVEIGVTKLNWDIENETYKSTTTKSRGYEERGPGMIDSSGSMEVLLDTAKTIETGWSITVGTIFALKEAIDANGTVWRSGYVICKKLNYVTDIGDIYRVGFDFEQAGAFSGAM